MSIELNYIIGAPEIPVSQVQPKIEEVDSTQLERVKKIKPLDLTSITNDCFTSLEDKKHPIKEPRNLNAFLVNRWTPSDHEDLTESLMLKIREQVKDENIISRSKKALKLLDQVGFSLEISQLVAPRLIDAIHTKEISSNDFLGRWKSFIQQIKNLSDLKLSWGAQSAIKGVIKRVTKFEDSKNSIKVNEPLSQIIQNFLYVLSKETSGEHRVYPGIVLETYFLKQMQEILAELTITKIREIIKYLYEVLQKFYKYMVLMTKIDETGNALRDFYKILQDVVLENPTISIKGLLKKFDAVFDFLEERRRKGNISLKDIYINAKNYAKFAFDLKLESQLNLTNHLLGKNKQRHVSFVNKNFNYDRARIYLFGVFNGNSEGYSYLDYIAKICNRCIVVRKDKSKKEDVLNFLDNLSKKLFILKSGDKEINRALIRETIKEILKGNERDYLFEEDLPESTRASIQGWFSDFSDRIVNLLLKLASKIDDEDKNQSFLRLVSRIKKAMKDDKGAFSGFLENLEWLADHGLTLPVAERMCQVENRYQLSLIENLVKEFREKVNQPNDVDRRLSFLMDVLQITGKDKGKYHGCSEVVKKYSNSQNQTYIPGFREKFNRFLIVYSARVSGKDGLYDSNYRRTTDVFDKLVQSLNKDVRDLLSLRIINVLVNYMEQFEVVSYEDVYNILKGFNALLKDTDINGTRTLQVLTSDKFLNNLKSQVGNYDDKSFIKLSELLRSILKIQDPRGSQVARETRNKILILVANLIANGQEIQIQDVDKLTSSFVLFEKSLIDKVLAFYKTPPYPNFHSVISSLELSKDWKLEPSSQEDKSKKVVKVGDDEAVFGKAKKGISTVPSFGDRKKYWKKIFEKIALYRGFTREIQSSTGLIFKTKKKEKYSIDLSNVAKNCLSEIKELAESVEPSVFLKMDLVVISLNAIVLNYNHGNLKDGDFIGWSELFKTKDAEEVKIFLLGLIMYLQFEGNTLSGYMASYKNYMKSYKNSSLKDRKEQCSYWFKLSGKSLAENEKNFFKYQGFYGLVLQSMKHLQLSTLLELVSHIEALKLERSQKDALYKLLDFSDHEQSKTILGILSTISKEAFSGELQLKVTKSVVALSKEGLNLSPVTIMLDVVNKKHKDLDVSKKTLLEFYVKDKKDVRDSISIDDNLDLYLWRQVFSNWDNRIGNRVKTVKNFDGTDGVEKELAELIEVISNSNSPVILTLPDGVNEAFSTLLIDRFYVIEKKNKKVQGLLVTCFRQMAVLRVSSTSTSNSKNYFQENARYFMGILTLKKLSIESRNQFMNVIAELPSAGLDQGVLSRGLQGIFNFLYDQDNVQQEFSVNLIKVFQRYMQRNEKIQDKTFERLFYLHKNKPELFSKFMGSTLLLEEFLNQMGESISTQLDEKNKTLEASSRKPCDREDGNGFKPEKAKSLISKIFMHNGLEGLENPDLRYIINYLSSLTDLSKFSTKDLLGLSKVFSKSLKSEETKDVPRDVSHVVAFVAELLYRIKGQPGGRGKSFELNTTQYMAVCSMLLNPESSALTQMATGEGKTRVIMVLAAIQYLMGRRVNIATANLDLAERDFLEFQSFFQALGVAEDEYVLLTPNSVDTDYKKAKICFGAIDDYPGVAVSSIENSVLILDECDTALYERDAMRYVVRRSDEKTSDSVIEISKPECFYNKIVVQAQSSDEIGDSFLQDLGLSGTISKKEVQDLIENAKIILGLKEGCDFILESKVDNNVTSYCAVPVINGTKRPEMQFDWGIQSCLHAHLKSQEKYQDYNFSLDKHLFVPRASTKTMRDFLQHYYAGENRLYGLSGTVGSPSERSALTNKMNHPLRFISMPRHVESHRQDLPLRILNGKDRHHEVLVAYVREQIKSGNPVLLFCKNDRESEKLEKVIRNAFNGSKAPIHRLTAATDKEEVKEYIDQKIGFDDQGSGSPCITLATDRIGRGQDIKVDSGKSLSIFLTYLPKTERDYWQLVGRSGRYGAGGQTRMLLNKDSLLKQLAIQEKYLFAASEEVIRVYWLMFSQRKTIKALLEEHLASDGQENTADKLAQAEKLDKLFKEVSALLFSASDLDVEAITTEIEEVIKKQGVGNVSKELNPKLAQYIQLSRKDLDEVWDELNGNLSTSSGISDDEALVGRGYRGKNRFGFVETWINALRAKWRGEGVLFANRKRRRLFKKKRKELEKKIYKMLDRLDRGISAGRRDDKEKPTNPDEKAVAKRLVRDNIRFGHV